MKSSFPRNETIVRKPGWERGCALGLDFMVYYCCPDTRFYMPKHIIIADSSVGEERRYVASSKRGVLTAEVTDAALFASEEAATAGVRDLLTKDFERKSKVTLSLGTITFTVTATKPVRRTSPKSGFVIRRDKGECRGKCDYYKGPKTKPPRNFRDAHYAYVENRDAATVFPSREKAESYGELCREILKDTADRELKSTRPSPTYQTLYENFAFTVEAV